MIEIALGLLLIAVALVVLMGAGDMLPGGVPIDLLPLIGYGGIVFVLAVGVLLVAAGATRRAIALRPERRHALRTARLTTIAVLIMAGLVIGLALTPGVFNLVRIGGFPAGYYVAAQGALIGLVILAFVWATRQNRIDAEERGP